MQSHDAPRPSDDPGAPTILEDLASLDLRAPEAAAAEVYDRPIGIRLLFADPVSGEGHYLVRYPAGLRGRIHRHSSSHTLVVLC